MPVRVSPTGRIRRHIDDLFARDKPLPEILEDVARLGAQLLMQAALEAEVTEFPGRDRYQRAAGCQDAPAGSRNGYREVTVKTTAGPVALARPKLRDRGLASPLLAVSDGNSGLIGAIEQVYRRPCASAASSTGLGTYFRRSRPGCRPRSRTRSGRSSIPRT